MTARRKKRRPAASPQARAGGPPSDGAAEGRRAAVAVAAVLAAAAAVAYTRSLGNGFVWDDNPYVLDNRGIRGGLTPESAAWALRARHSSNWHPLTWLSHAADVSLHGLDRPWGHHLTNLLLHAANTVLLFIVLNRLTRRLWPSAVVAALFALHPLHVESVAWVAERKDLLCALFMFLAIWAYASYAARPSWRRYLLVVAAFAAALMSKPMAVTLPVVLLVLDWWPLGRLSRRSVLEKIPLFVMTVASCVVTLHVQHAGGAMRDVRALGMGERAANAVYACGMYLVQAAWPAPGRLVPFHPLPGFGGPAVGPWQVAVLGLMLAAVTALAVHHRRRRPFLLAGWLVYGVMLVPVIGLVQVGRQLMADRYTYVPLVGVFVAVVFLVAHLVAGRPGLRRAAATLAVVVLAALGGLTWHQQRLWADPVTFWSYVAEAYPRTSLPHNNLARLHSIQGDLPRATAGYRKALSLEPGNHALNCNLGIILLRADRPDEALPYLLRARELNPRWARTHYGLGRAMIKKGRKPEAAVHLARAVELEPDFAHAHAQLGAVLFDLGRPDEAVDHLTRALALKPDYAEARVNLGAAMLLRGQWGAAAEHLRAAVRQDPDLAPAWKYLGIALRELGQTDEAEQCFTRAEQLGLSRTPDRPAP